MKLLKNKSFLILLSFISLYLYELLFELPYTKKTIDNFFPLIYLSAISLLIVFWQTNKKAEMPKGAITAFYLFFLWNFVSFTRSAITASEYLGYKIIVYQ